MAVNLCFCMYKEVSISKNLVLGRRVRTVLGVYILALLRRSVAFRRWNGEYIILPARFITSWSRGMILERIDFLYRTKKKR